MSEAQRISDEYEARHRARCPVCSKWLVPQTNGKLRHHHRELLVGTFFKSEKCPGSGRRDR